MTPEQKILAAVRAGVPVTERDVVATISSLEELDAYRRNLSTRGALTSDAMSAIKDRQDQLVRR